MADYTIINASGAELTDVNAAEEDVAAGTIVTGIALDGTELAALLLEDGVAVMQDAASGAEQAAVAALLEAEEGDTVQVRSASAAGAFATETLGQAGLVAALAAGKALVAASVSDTEKAKVARVLQSGTHSGVKTAL